MRQLFLADFDLVKTSLNNARIYFNEESSEYVLVLGRQDYYLSHLKNNIIQ